jgi:hypothetical protein
MILCAISADCVVMPLGLAVREMQSIWEMFAIWELFWS